jgi:alpha-galactosidase
VIAANLHRLILPRQSQIWAVLHAVDSMQRLVYLLTSGLLGRLCISGEIAALDPQQWALVKEAIQFYYQVAPVIARGKSRLYQFVSPSWQHLQGAQAVLRLAEDEHSALVVTHSFGSPLPAEIRVPLPGRGWQVAGCFPRSAPAPAILDGQLRYVPSQEWEGAGIYLTR